MNAWKKQTSTLARLLIVPLLALTISAPVFASGTVQQPAKAQAQTTQATNPVGQPTPLTEEDMAQVSGEFLPAWAVAILLGILGSAAWEFLVKPNACTVIHNFAQDAKRNPNWKWGPAWIRAHDFVHRHGICAY